MKTLLLILFFSIAARAEHQVSLLGLTLHMTPMNSATDRMLKNKISSGGEFVYNWQLNYMYINENETVFHGALIKDCFGNGAGFLAFGKRYEVKKDLYVGWELGFYGRQDPFPSDKKASGIEAPVKSGIYEFYPSPAFIIQKRISEHVLFRVHPNLILNSFDFAWSF